jgi:hypothetical protein
MIGMTRFLLGSMLGVLVGCEAGIEGMTLPGQLPGSGGTGNTSAGSGGSTMSSGSGGSTGTGGGAGSGTSFEVDRFTCSTAATPAELPLRRLTQKQYVNVVSDLLGRVGLSPADRTAIRQAIDEGVDSFPADRLVGVRGEKHGGFHRLDQALQQAHVDSSYTVAVAAGRELTSSTARRQAVMGACATDTNTANDAQCLRDFINRLGRLVHRRPVTADDMTFYLSTNGASTTPVDPPVVADIIALMLTSPHFLYAFEEGDPAAAGPTTLDAYALASRLSLFAWQTMPDDALLGVAADGGLATPAGYAAEVDRLFADSKTEAAYDEFFGEWWRLDELPPLNVNVGSTLFDTFAGSDRPNATLHTEMMGEVLEVARRVTKSGGKVSDLLTNKDFVARTDGLARLYGQSAWAGSGTPPTFAQSERHGMLTRAAFLATGTARTRPVMKGFRVRNAFLCQSIAPPPPGAAATPIDISATQTTRQVVEAITGQPTSSCAGCHNTLLNPLGFLTENFDSLGRKRTTERLFTEAGMLLGEQPVNTRAAPFVANSADEINDTQTLQELMLKGEFQTCFARQYFRYAFAREEDDTKDGCALAELQTAALSGEPVNQILKRAVLRPEFKRRDVR